jgi:hypothetical protein
MADGKPFIVPVVIDGTEPARLGVFLDKHDDLIS